MPRTPVQAEAWLRAKKTNVMDTCQLTQHEAYDVPSNGDATAYIDYEKSAHKHGPHETPWKGVLHRWGPKPGSPAGHVAFGVDDKGAILSTDWPHACHIGETTVAEITRAWGLPYIGFTEDIDGVRVAPKPVKHPKPKPHQRYDAPTKGRMRPSEQ